MRVLCAIGQGESDDRVAPIKSPGQHFDEELLFGRRAAGQEGEQANRRTENWLHSICLRRRAWLVKSAGARLCSKGGTSTFAERRQTASSELRSSVRK